ncbi:hypothetical protein BS17DRAFT_807208 [Gyrodon lividus]|nr:hypothetical protein BS17DRAFT_807208 [Gyrodon lividus]
MNLSMQPSNGMVAKPSWREEKRVNENTILAERAEKDEDVEGHVLVLLSSYEFSFSHSTSTVRQWDPVKGSRTLSILISRKLRSIKELTQDDMFKAWYQCVECHYTLWQAGIHHRDISCENLMYYMTDEGVMGVLNDFDVASLTNGGRLENERTGTIPFMAIELLREDDGQSGRVEHIYRHNLESFIWVFIWICFQYNGGKMVEKPRPLGIWAKVDPSECAEKKNDFLNRDLELPNHLTGASGGRVESFVSFLRQYLHARAQLERELQMALRRLDGSTLAAHKREEVEQEVRQLKAALDEQPAQDVFDRFLQVIRSAGP